MYQNMSPHIVPLWVLFLCKSKGPTGAASGIILLLHGSCKQQAMGSAHRRSACRFLLSVVVWLEISGLGSRRCLRKYVPLAVVRLAP